jgi:hypothetical protein
MLKVLKYLSLRQDQRLEVGLVEEKLLRTLGPRDLTKDIQRLASQSGSKISQNVSQIWATK